MTDPISGALPLSASASTGEPRRRGSAGDASIQRTQLIAKKALAPLNGNDSFNQAVHELVGKPPSNPLAPVPVKAPPKPPVAPYGPLPAPPVRQVPDGNPNLLIARHNLQQETAQNIEIVTPNVNAADESGPQFSVEVIRGHYEPSFKEKVKDCFARIGAYFKKIKEEKQEALKQREISRQGAADREAARRAEPTASEIARDYLNVGREVPAEQIPPANTPLLTKEQIFETYLNCRKDQATLISSFLLIDDAVSKAALSKQEKKTLFADIRVKEKGATLEDLEELKDGLAKRLAREKNTLKGIRDYHRHTDLLCELGIIKDPDLFLISVQVKAHEARIRLAEQAKLEEFRPYFSLLKDHFQKNGLWKGEINVPNFREQEANINVLPDGAWRLGDIIGPIYRDIGRSTIQLNGLFISKEKAPKEEAEKLKEKGLPLLLEELGLTSLMGEKLGKIEKFSGQQVRFTEEELREHGVALQGLTLMQQGVIAPFLKPLMDKFHDKDEEGYTKHGFEIIKDGVSTDFIVTHDSGYKLIANYSKDTKKLELEVVTKSAIKHMGSEFKMPIVVDMTIKIDADGNGKMTWKTVFTDEQFASVPSEPVAPPVQGQQIAPDMFIDLTKPAQVPLYSGSKG
ncbi:MAG: hypothetical protein KGJ02_03915 [Verrucomicrobiota bacterium]|nr:hypothetical protein [Verrucomicrobiota bacterium]